MKKRKIKCPYFILLILTSVCFLCLNILHEQGMLSFIKENLSKVHVTQDKTESQSGGANKESINSEGDKNGSAENDGEGNAGTGTEEGKTNSQMNTVSGNGILGATVSGNTVSGNQGWNADEFESMYLSDTLFIGDSRTVTLYEYGGWDEATFFAKDGLNIWDVMEKKIADYHGEKITVDEALQKERFDRIYIMLGVNELGRGTPETFAEQYGKVIDRIQELQPDALIIVQAIMHVSAEKDKEQTYINNTEINARNSKLKEMAEQKEVKWLDVNPVTDDEETGCLLGTYSFDGVHLKVKYLDIWKQFILDNPF